MIDSFEDSYYIIYNVREKRIENASRLFLINYNLKEDISKIIPIKNNKIVSLKAKNLKINYFLVKKTILKNNTTVINLIEINSLANNLFYCPITFLPNRKVFIDYLKISPNKRGFLCLIDFDNFATVNDVYSSEIGNKVLAKFASFLKTIFKNYSIFRLKDDDFAIYIANEIDYKKAIKYVYAAISSFLSKPLQIDGEKISLECTMSFACEENLYILKYADEALKYAKKENLKYFIYDPKVIVTKEVKSYNMIIANKIKYCIENNKVTPYYQPIIDNETKTISKYEALMRLEYKGEILYPAQFMDLSYKTKTYLQLTKRMLYRIFKDVNEYNIKVSVNISYEDIKSYDVMYKLFNLLSECKYPQNITFEIIEVLEVKNMRKLKTFIDKVKEYGVKIAIDDFGTGYSNFQYFSKFDFDYLKIDGLFIKDITFNKKHQSIVEALYNLIKDTKIKLIAEFVENKMIFEKVVENNIHFSQGYYFNKALSIEEVIKNKVEVKNF